MSITLKVAILRAKCVARRCIGRAAGYLVAAGVALADAVRFVLAVLRAQRVAA